MNSHESHALYRGGNAWEDPAMCRRPAGRDHAPAKFVTKSVTIGHENGPRSDLRGPFYLVAGTGFEPATSGL